MSTLLGWPQGSFCTVWPCMHAGVAVSQQMQVAKNLQMMGRSAFTGGSLKDPFTDVAL